MRSVRRRPVWGAVTVYWLGALTVAGCRVRRARSHRSSSGDGTALDVTGTTRREQR